MMMFQSYCASHFQKLDKYSKLRWRRWHRRALLSNDCEFWLRAAGPEINDKLSILLLARFADPGTTVSVTDRK